MDKFKPFRLSPITRKVIKYMSGLSEGTLALYDELSELIDLECAPGGDGYPYVLSAIRIIERDGHNFVNVRKEGYRKINPNETVYDVQHRQLNLRKTVKRGLVKITAIDYKRLGAIEKLEYQAAMVVGTLTKRVLSRKGRTKLLGRIKKEPEKIDYDNLTDIYLRRNKNIGDEVA